MPVAFEVLFAQRLHRAAFRIGTLMRALNRHVERPFDTSANALGTHPWAERPMGISWRRTANFFLIRCAAVSYGEIECSPCCNKRRTRNVCPPLSSSRGLTFKSHDLPSKRTRFIV